MDQFPTGDLDQFPTGASISAEEVTEELVTLECKFGGELDFSLSFELNTVVDDHVAPFKSCREPIPQRSWGGRDK